jgi:choline kinase
MTIKRAVILSAGKGSRLYPHTEDRPKCLLGLSGRTLLEWQLDALYESGVREMAVVTGFRHQAVADVVAGRGNARGKVELVFNPFFQVADNLGSVWMARQWLQGDTLLLNGDTLISPALLAAVQKGGAAPITVTVDRKDNYDADDMKVLRAGGRLLRIGKALTEYNAESIGLLAFRGEGAALFSDKVDEVMATEEGVRVWYLSVIDALAPSGTVGTCLIEGEDWQEVDYPSDLDAARALTAAWSGQGW